MYIFCGEKDSFNHMLDHLSKNILRKWQRINNDFERLRAMVTEKYDVKINSPYEVFCNPASLTIVYTIKEFQPFGEHLTKHTNLWVHLFLHDEK